MWRRIIENGEEKDKESGIVAVREKAGEKLCLYFFHYLSRRTDIAK
jgi:hypothetical protein